MIAYEQDYKYVPPKNYVCLRTVESWVMFLTVTRSYNIVFMIKKLRGK